MDKTCDAKRGHPQEEEGEQCDNEEAHSRDDGICCEHGLHLIDMELLLALRWGDFIWGDVGNALRVVREGEVPMKCGRDGAGAVWWAVGVILILCIVLQLLVLHLFWGGLHHLCEL